jgi:hypothetical protein
MPEQPAAIWNVAVATPFETTTEAFVTAPFRPGHWTGGTPAVVRPPSLGAATGVPFEPDEPEPPPPVSPPLGGLGGVCTGGAATGPGAEVGGVVPPGEVGGDVPPGLVGGVVPPGAGVPGRGRFGLLVFADTADPCVRPVGSVVRPTAARSDGAADPCRTVFAVTLEWPALRIAGITSVLPLNAPGTRGRRTFGAGSTACKA